MENNKKLKQKIISQYWKTPFYYYDLNKIEKNYRDLENSLMNEFKIFYSMKSNPHRGILKKLKSLEKIMIDTEKEIEGLVIYLQPLFKRDIQFSYSKNGTEITDNNGSLGTVEDFFIENKI